MVATEAEVVTYLNELKWPVSPQMFNALFRASPTVTFELVVLQKRFLRRTKVILLIRPDDDTEFPGKLHVPGTVMRRGDTSETALQRLCRELKGARFTTPEFVDILDFPIGGGPDECSRGQIVQRLYVSRLRGKTLPEGGILADAADLPLEKFGWPFQRHLVARAIRHVRWRFWWSWW
jgi:ADP-ribose pyrophosphatase YjhB (NUDIX family)